MFRSSTSTVGGGDFKAGDIDVGFPPLVLRSQIVSLMEEMEVRNKDQPLFQQKEKYSGIL